MQTGRNCLYCSSHVTQAPPQATGESLFKSSEGNNAWSLSLSIHWFLFFDHQTRASALVAVDGSLLTLSVSTCANGGRPLLVSERLYCFVISATIRTKSSALKPAHRALSFLSFPAPPRPAEPQLEHARHCHLRAFSKSLCLLVWDFLAMRP